MIHGTKKYPWDILWSQKTMKMSCKDKTDYLSQRNNNYRAVLMKSIFVTSENVGFLGYFTEVSFVTSEGN